MALGSTHHHTYYALLRLTDLTMTYYGFLWLQVLEEIASSDKCNVGGILLDDDTKEVGQ